MSTLTRRLTVAATSIGVAALAVTALPAAAEGSSDVHVVHGIPGVPVDVYVNGDLTLDDFQPNSRTDALTLEMGDYDIEVYAGDGVPGDADPVIDQTVAVPGGNLDLDLVAHYAEDGTPQLSAFVNDLSTTAGGSARLTVRHTAAAPAVDVLANGGAVIEDLANPGAESLEVPEATYEVAVNPAGADATVIGPLDLAVTSGVQTIVYAVGTLGDDLTVYPFTVDVGEVTFDRLAGKDRTLTAIEISRRAFPDGAAVAYLARNDVFVDAVAGGTLTDGPILLVPSCGELPTHVGEELTRLGVDEVIGLGGPVAICDDILEQAVAAS